MGRIITSFTKFVGALRESNAMSMQELVSILVQVSEKNDAVKAHIVYNDSVVGEFVLNRGGKTKAIGRSGEKVNVFYYAGSVEGIKIQSYDLSDVKRLIVSLPKNYKEMDKKTIDGVTGILLSGKGQSIVTSALDGATIKELPVTGSPAAYAFMSGPGKSSVAKKEKEQRKVATENGDESSDEEAGGVVFSVEANFKYDSADVTQKGSDNTTPKEKIDAAVKKALESLKRSNTSSIEVVIQAYASREGDEEYNLKLSQKRAEAAASYINSLNTAIRAVKAQGMGETDKFSKSELAPNRRIVAVKK